MTDLTSGQSGAIFDTAANQRRPRPIGGATVEAFHPSTRDSYSEPVAAKIEVKQSTLRKFYLGRRAVTNERNVGK